MTERDKIIERIRQLRERTMARGCTEAEALAAAEKAAELMAKLGLSENDIAFGQAEDEVPSKGNTPRLKVWNTIALCTNTALILGDSRRSERGGTVTFVGLAPYPEVAVYLRDVCDRAITREIAQFRKSDFYRRRRTAKTKSQAIYDFSETLTFRLSRRLFDLFENVRDDEQRSTALAELKRRFPRTAVTKVKTRKQRFDHASVEGYRAGDRVNLSHGVGAAAGPAGLIGSRS